MSDYHQLNIELYKNNFENSENMYYARPTTDRTLTVSEVAQRAVSRGGATMTAEEIVRGFNELMEEALYNVCDGYAMLTDYFKMSLKIEGTFADTKDEFDSTRHKLKFCFTATDTMREELSNISVEIDRIAEVGPTIAHVINNYNGETNSTITPGHVITIEGDRIKISGDDTSCGVYLIASDGTETQLSGNSILTNEPKNLMVLVPTDLAAGTYNVRVTTQYSTSKYNTSSPRSSSSDIELTAS